MNPTEGPAFEIINSDEKPCRKCGEVKKVDQFQKNPNTKDGHNSVCFGCHRKPEKPKEPGEELLTDEMAQLFRTGDAAKDFFVRQLLRVAVTGRNEQAQLGAIRMIFEILGINKETPVTEADLIHQAFQRMKKQKEPNATGS